MNISHFIGRLVREPELKATKNDTKICVFTLAIDGYKRKDQDKADVAFADFTAFGATGENIAKYFHKGAPIAVHAMLRQDSWTAKDGKKMTKLAFNVTGFNFIPAVSNSRTNESGEDVEPEAPDYDRTIPF